MIVEPISTITHEMKCMIATELTHSPIIENDKPERPGTDNLICLFTVFLRATETDISPVTEAVISALTDKVISTHIPSLSTIENPEAIETDILSVTETEFLTTTERNRSIG